MPKSDHYDAFISYSHLEDDILAATLQAGLETFARPWYRPRVVRIFRDTTDLSATPGLLSTIISAMRVSDWFVLIASEQAARSHWVGEEVSWWLANKDRGKFLIALSSGWIQWKDKDFDWEYTTALPRVLSGAFAEEPGWADLRSVKKALAESADVAVAPHRLGRRRAQHQVGDWVADLAAPIRGAAKDTLVGEHLRYRKRTRRIVQTVVATLAALVITASVTAGVAVNQLGQARLQARIATSREVAALSGSLLASHLDLAELFAVEAYRLHQSPQTLTALFQAVTAGPRLATYLQATGPVSAIAGSADGNVIMAGLSDGKILRWSLPSTQPTVIAEARGPISRILVDSRGTAAVALSGAGALRWGAGTGARPLRTPAGRKPVAVGISPSGSFAASVSIPPNAVFNLRFDLTLYDQDADVVNTTEIESGEGWPQYIAFPSESQVVTFDGSLGTWHRLSVPGLRPIAGYVTAFGVHDNAAALSPGGEFFSYSNAGTTLPVWTTNGGPTTLVKPPLSAPTEGNNPTALAINATGSLIAQADDGSIYLSDITHSGTSAPPLALTGNSVINTGALSFMGRNDLLSASGNLLTLWKLQQYSRIATETSIMAPFPCDACAGPLGSIRPGGRQMAAVINSGETMTVQNLTSRTKATVWPAGSSTYGPPLWSRDGKHLYVLTANGGAQVWSVGRNLTRSAVWPSSSVAEKAAGYTPSSGALTPPDFVSLAHGEGPAVEIDSTGAILVRNTVTGAIEKLIPGPHSLQNYGGLGQNYAAADPDGQIAAVAAPNGVFVTTIATGRSRKLPGNINSRVAFDGERLLVQQPSGPLQIWNIDATHLIKVIAGTPNTVAGPVADASGLAVETRSDGSAVVLDLNSGATLGTFYPPVGARVASTGIAMLPTGTSLITVTESSTASPYGELTNWQMSAGAWLKAACASAGHALTTAEWQEYVGGPVPGQLACSA